MQLSEKATIGNEGRRGSGLLEWDRRLPSLVAHQPVDEIGQT